MISSSKNLFYIAIIYYHVRYFTTYHFITTRWMKLISGHDTLYIRRIFFSSEHQWIVQKIFVNVIIFALAKCLGNNNFIHPSMQNRKRFTGACRGFSNRCGAKNSAREKYLSATPKFLSATSKAFRLVWLILLLFGFFIVAPTVGEKGVAIIVGEKTSLITPLCTRL